MSRIVGLGDKEKEKNKDKKNEYYTGGVDNKTGGGSGLAVEGPPPSSGRRPGTSSSLDPFENIVRQAQSVDRGSSDTSSAPSNSAPIIITLYRNGFLVNDGPLRDLTSPESRAFLAQLERGQLPAELQSSSADGAAGVVGVQLSDKRQEDYVPPPLPAYVAFSGTGTRIGSVAEPQSSEAFVFSADILDNIVEIDESKPSTTVQVKTYDGKKLRLKVNLDSSVLHLAALIHRSNSSSVGLFTLNAGYPPRDIVDPTLTIKDADLVGASITQKQL